MLKPHGLSRTERLRGRTAVAEIFEGDNSKSQTAFPIRVIYKGNCKNINRILISVPKRYLHNAVDRNCVKRHIREAYRLNKSIINETVHYDLAFIYITSKVLAGKEIRARIVTLLKKICQLSAKV